MTKLLNKSQTCSICKIVNPPSGFTKTCPYYCYDCFRILQRQKKFEKTGIVVVPRNKWKDGYKVCPQCRRRKALVDYSSVRVAWCRQCCREHRRKKSLTEEFKEDRRDYVRAFNKTEKGKVVTKEAHLKSEYGLTLADKEQMLIEQKSKCAICHTKEPSNRGWMVDHCHATGKIRELLCDRCNKMLGFALDNPSILYSGINYLIRHQINNNPGIAVQGMEKPEDEYDHEIEEES